MYLEDMLVAKRASNIRTRSGPTYVPSGPELNTSKAHLIIAFLPEYALGWGETLRSVRERLLPNQAELIVVGSSLQHSSLAGLATLLVPRRGSVLGAVLCTCAFLTASRINFSHVSLVSLDSPSNAAHGILSHYPVKGARFAVRPAMSELAFAVHSQYAKDILSQIYRLAYTAADAVVWIGFSMERAAFNRVFSEAASALYPLLNEKGSFDPNWVRWYYDRQDELPETLRSDWDSGMCKGCAHDLVDSSGSLEFCQIEGALSLCVGQVLKWAGIEYECEDIVVRDNSDTDAADIGVGPIKWADLLTKLDVGDVVGPASQLGYSSSCAGTGRVLYVGIPKDISIIHSDCILLVTPACVGSFERIRQNGHRLTILSSSVYCQSMLAAEGTTSRLLLPPGMLDCSEMILERSDNYEWLVIGNDGERSDLSAMSNYVERRSFDVDERRPGSRWIELLGQPLAVELSTDKGWSTGLLFCLLEQVASDEPFMCVRSSRAPKRATDLWHKTPCDFDILYQDDVVPYPSMVFSLRGANRVLDLVRSYKVRGSEVDRSYIDMRFLLELFAREDSLVVYEWVN